MYCKADGGSLFLLFWTPPEACAFPEELMVTGGLVATVGFVEVTSSTVEVRTPSTVRKEIVDFEPPPPGATCKPVGII